MVINTLPHHHPEVSTTTSGDSSASRGVRGGAVSMNKTTLAYQEENQPRPTMVSLSPSELDQQCGDDMLDTVDSVVGCVNQNHVELQHQYEEATYCIISTATGAAAAAATTTDDNNNADGQQQTKQKQQQADDQHRSSCSSEEGLLEAVQCGATEPMGDLMLLAAYSSLSGPLNCQPVQQYLQLPPPPLPTPSSTPSSSPQQTTTTTSSGTSSRNNTRRTSPVTSSSLYQCQDCAATKTLRQLQPDVRETIWWPCEQCQKDCRWNPFTTTMSTTITPALDNWSDEAVAAAVAHRVAACVIQ